MTDPHKDSPPDPIAQPAPTLSVEISAAAESAPLQRRGLLARLWGAVPTLAVLALLALVGVWGHQTGWKLPHFAASSLETDADWCAEHNVPEEICIACNADLMPKGQLYGWCREHGVAECPWEHPELAELAETPAASPADRQAVATALALRPRPENNPSCKLHLRRIQFASDQAVEKAGVDVRLVQRGPITETISAPGQVAYDPTLVARLSARSDGTVWWVAKNLGDTVIAGEVLALVDSAELGRAKAALLQAAANLELKAETYRRFLGAEDAVSQQRLLETQAEFDSAEIALQGAVQQLVNLGLPLTLDEVSGQPAGDLVDKIRWLGLPTSLVTQLDPATTSANLLPIVAPRAGVVTTRDVVAGEVVAAGQAIFTIVDPSRMWLLLDVPQEEIPYLKLGQQVRFRSEGAPGEAQGAITWISTDVDPETRTVKVRAELPNESGPLRKSLFGTAEIILRHDDNAIVVPSDAIHWEGCCHVAFVRDRHYLEPDAYKVYHTRMVRPGVTQNGRTEVLAGLLPGELVVTSGGGALRSELLKGNLGAG